MRGRSFWNRHSAAHEVPIAPVAKTDDLVALVRMEKTPAAGSARNFLYEARAPRALSVVRRRNSRGSSEAMKWIYVFRHEGSEGWRRAQWREVIVGWAGETTGAIEPRALGRVDASGKRIGEENGG